MFDSKQLHVAAFGDDREGLEARLSGRVKTSQAAVVELHAAEAAEIKCLGEQWCIHLAICRSLCDSLPKVLDGAKLVGVLLFCSSVVEVCRRQEWKRRHFESRPEPRPERRFCHGSEVTKRGMCEGNKSKISWTQESFESFP